MKDLRTSSTTVNQSYLRKISDEAFLLKPTSDFTGPKRHTEKGQVNCLGTLQSIRVAILPLPVPHTGLVILLFFCLEKTPHLRNHWGCFLKVSVWQGDRGHHSLPFLSFGKTEGNWKGGPQLPPWRPSLPLLSPPQHLPTVPTTAWVDSPGWFSDLPCLCDTSSIVRGRQRTGSWGVGRAGLKVSSISRCMMDAERGPGHLKMRQTRRTNACSSTLILLQLPFYHPLYVSLLHTYSTNVYCPSVCMDTFCAPKYLFRARTHDFKAEKVLKEDIWVHF